MITTRFFQLKTVTALLFVTSALFMSSCSDDDPVELRSSTFAYELHNGQAVPTAPYAGTHPNDFSASMQVQEMENGNAEITITLNNTVGGATYHMHAHDGADAASTPNGTPYNETPNSDLFAQSAQGNGGSVSVSQMADMDYNDIINDYAGFFVVHDPLQNVSTTDIGTYLVVGGFAREQASTNFSSMTFSYDFNTGQLVPDFAYTGTHSTDLGASIRVDELAGDQTRVVVSLMNTMDGMTYHTHAHDMADPATTPNGTPYMESPNGGVFAGPITGNGGTARATNVSSMSYNDIIGSYDGFLVVHDPLQAVTTVDPTTYVILGVFAR